MEIELVGGINTVVRIGDRVHRPSAAWSPAVRELVRVLGTAHVPVPAWHGVDDEGRDVFDFLPGEVGTYPIPEAIRSDAALVSAAQVLRQFHDASVQLVSRDLPWQLPPLPGAEVVVHGDYAPYNLVYSGEVVSGVIDLDYARPGPRTYDLAYAVYRFAPLTTAADGWGSLAQRAGRVRRFCEAYGLDACSIDETLAAVAPRLRGMVAYMRSEAAVGHPAFSRHVAEGHDELYERDADYAEERARDLAF